MHMSSAGNAPVSSCSSCTHQCNLQCTYTTSRWCTETPSCTLMQVQQVLTIFTNFQVQATLTPWLPEGGRRHYFGSQSAFRFSGRRPANASPLNDSHRISCQVSWVKGGRHCSFK
uniref:Uncharacterized protein n=1 Tax=Engystomops pustulosus TaxID=76066 RepID=A0AAV6YMJ9_ENGPU|nr:hypothetical protein GDO81_022234 [Engystomops pustulosus]